MGIKEEIEAKLHEKMDGVSDEVTHPAEEQTQEETHEEQEPVQQEWQPDYKYSIKSEDHEFDEFIRPAIKDPETEKQVRELYTRAYGLDHVKANLEQERERARQFEEQTNTFKSEAELAKQGIEGLKKLAKEDFASFAHLAGIEDNTILNYANNRLDYREKPEHERRMIDSDMERRTQSYQNNIEMENLRRQNIALMQHQHQTKLSQAMAVPEIAEFEKAFNSKMGEGAFRQHVNNYGSMQYKSTQQYVEPSIAVQQIYSQFKPLFMDKLEQVNKQGTNTTTKPPTNLGPGRTSSVVTKRLKSLADLRKRANELAKAEGYGG